ncbi:signal peptidase I [Velocimicrobium porci]|uniref:Signal peptidase I n=1 Tax=Velocimicrobium porci TaxID=2606634 RepID=A0A6L5Y3H0_9FIRM|nr:signal peptidase I [Velocimicrobium porci]MSS64693.1 signal peptidase I [Velocimicrobium porci]
MTTKNDTPKQEKPKLISALWQYTLIVAIVFFFLLICPKFVYGSTLVDGASMENTLHTNDRIFHEMISYRFHEPERFDVVQLQSPVEEDTFWVKRIIGLPDETIQIKNGTIYINNKKLKNDTYGNAPIDYAGIAEKTYKIPEGHYFLMGDNRKSDISWDSRYEEIGAIPRENILAKLIFRYYPFNQIGTIN